LHSCKILDQDSDPKLLLMVFFAVSCRYAYTDVSLAEGDVNGREDRLVYDYSIKPDLANHNYRYEVTFRLFDYKN
jgi:hypothetical protein